MPQAKGRRARDVTHNMSSLWQNPDYAAWWTGSTVSALGTSMSTFAYPLIILFATGSVAKAGLIGSANLVGMLISMLWGGALADRLSRQAILVAGPILQAVVLACVALLIAAHRVLIPLLAVAALLTGIVSALVLGASAPALRRIVPPDQLPAASAQTVSRDMAVQLLANPFTGFIITIARWLPFGADAISYLFAALGAALIRRPLGPDTSERHQQNTMIQDIADGIRFVWRQPFLRFTVLFGSLVNLTSTAFSLLVIALIRYRGGGPTQIGFITASAVAGGLTGSAIAPVLMRRLRARVIMYIAMWSYTAAIPLVALAPALWQIALVLLLASVASVPVIVVVESYATRVVPDEYIGREAAVSRFGAYALMWTGPLIAGGLASFLGIRGGVVALLVLAIPLTISVHRSKPLSILNQAIGQVQPTSVTAEGGRPQNVASFSETGQEQQRRTKQ